MFTLVFFLARGSKTRMGWQGILIAESIHVAHKCVDGDEMLVLGRDWGHRQSASSLFTCHWLECVAFLRVGDCISLTLAKSWRNKMVLSVLISKRTWIKWNLFAFNLISLIKQRYSLKLTLNTDWAQHLEYQRLEYRHLR